MKNMIYACVDPKIINGKPECLLEGNLSFGQIMGYLGRALITNKYKNGLYTFSPTARPYAAPQEYANASLAPYDLTSAIYSAAELANFSYPTGMRVYKPHFTQTLANLSQSDSSCKDALCVLKPTIQTFPAGSPQTKWNWCEAHFGYCIDNLMRAYMHTNCKYTCNKYKRP